MIDLNIKKALECEVCRTYADKLYEKGKKKVCFYCKKDFNKNGFFTRIRVKHDYQKAEETARIARRRK